MQCRPLLIFAACFSLLVFRCLLRGVNVGLHSLTRKPVFTLSLPIHGQVAPTRWHQTNVNWPWLVLCLSAFWSGMVQFRFRLTRIRVCFTGWSFALLYWLILCFWLCLYARVFDGGGGGILTDYFRNYFLNLQIDLLICWWSDQRILAIFGSSVDLGSINNFF